MGNEVEREQKALASNKPTKPVAHWQAVMKQEIGHMSSTVVEQKGRP